MTMQALRLRRGGEVVQACPIYDGWGGHTCPMSEGWGTRHAICFGAWRGVVKAYPISEGGGAGTPYAGFCRRPCTLTVYPSALNVPLKAGLFSRLLGAGPSAKGSLDWARWSG